MKKLLIPVKASTFKYDIVLKNGSINRLKEYLNLNRKVLVVTDDKVPREYSKAVENSSKEAFAVVLKSGEQSKNFDNLKYILEVMTKEKFTRTDCVVAVGGGVIGDISGFAASVYMRGIDFYNIPTTLLSQVDSSVGGKTAVDFCGYKNIVGAFYPPKCVVIDTNTLKTLDKRQVASGLAEVIKMSVTSDKELFEFLEREDFYGNIDYVIERSLKIKKSVVEEDERENGVRKILNFGHTLGHAIESADNMKNYLHGECVAMGMPLFCDKKIRERVKNLLKKYSLPFSLPYDIDFLADYIVHDKKADGEFLSIVFCEDIGKNRIEKIKLTELQSFIERNL